MASSLSNLVNNKGVNKCKFIDDDKECETCGITYKYCNCFLKYKKFKDDLIQYKCSCCNEYY